MNTPYVKHYDENGVVTNPIQKSYISMDENRRARRSKEPRFRGNNNGYALAITPAGKFHKVLQRIVLPGGKAKVICHYKEC